jgi:diguanylate cyclase (GGDEF)-like protein
MDSLEIRAFDNPNVKNALRGRSIAGWTLLILLVGFLITGLLVRYTQLDREKQVQSYFDFRVRNAVMLITTRVHAYQQVLFSTAGLFQASNNVGRNEFKIFANAQLLSENYPGIQGVGYSLIVPPAQKNSHIASVRAEGFPNYNLRPEGPRDLYTSIVYLEPFSDRNLRAFGFDMYSEPVRHAAMQKALDSDQAAVSDKVTLMQEAGKDVQAGFLIYLPVYRNGRPHSNVIERRENALGWVYAPFRMNDFMSGVLGERGNDLSIEIFDGDTTSPNALMYESNMVAVDSSAKFANMVQVQRIELLDQVWTLKAYPNASLMSRVYSNRPELFAAVGVPISVLLALVVWLLLSSRQLALKHAEDLDTTLVFEKNLTEELSIQNDENLRMSETLRIANEGLHLQNEEVLKRAEELAKQKLALEASEAEVKKLAFYDALTELPNRRLLNERLQSVQLTSSRTRKYAALMFLDMDRFKILNDTLGHDYGDLMLIEVANRLRSSVRESDTVARLGGDEFIVLLDMLDEQFTVAMGSATLIAEKIRASLATPYTLKNTNYNSSPSIGVTMFFGKEMLAEDIYKQADIAMYEAKNGGRNRVCFFDPSVDSEKIQST